jgi:hypothetical protein
MRDPKRVGLELVEHHVETRVDIDVGPAEAAASSALAPPARQRSSGWVDHIRSGASAIGRHGNARHRLVAKAWAGARGVGGALRGGSNVD